MSSRSSITRLLNEWSAGNPAALDELTPQVYRELHALARRYLAWDGAKYTLQATALINEAYLRLIEQPEAIQWESRAHFFGIAARLMRNILADYARARKAAKRGGDLVAVTFDEAAFLPDHKSPDILDLDEALTRLSEVDERKAKVIELRYYGGMTTEEIATVTRSSATTVKRDVRLAEAWLRRHLRSREGCA